MAADPAFFEIFSFHLIVGEASEVLDEPNTAVITEAIAAKYFGDEEAVGKALEIDGVLVNITGVMLEMPDNAHFHADLLISMKTREPSYPKWVLSNATGTSHFTYVQLAPGIAATEVEMQLAAYLLAKDKDYAESRRYFLQPVRDIHLRSGLTAEIEANGDILYVYLLSAVALIILIMASINYMSLAIAHSANRSREVGIRKVVGARRRQIVQQFLGEAVVTALLAVILAVFLVEISMPLFNELSGKTLALNLTRNLNFTVGLLALALMVGALAGSYPAIFLSALKSVNVLKGKFLKTGNRSLSLRKGLLLTQFTMSTILLLSTMTVFMQLDFMRNKKLGIQPELVVTAPLQTEEISTRYEQLRTRLLSHSGIVNVSATNNRLTSRIAHWRGYELPDREKEIFVPTAVVTHDFFASLQAEVIAGRDFDRSFTADANNAYIINEAAADFLELDSPVGTPLTGAMFTGSLWSRKKATIIGVVKNFHLASLHQEIQPTIFSLYSEKTTPLRLMAIRISGGGVAQELAFIRQTWQSLVPERPIQLTFLDSDIEKLYNSETRFLKVFMTFTAVAILITCLGLLGLSSYAAAQRTREIGIRKVLGASSATIVRLLSAEFLKLVIVASLLAWPVGWYVMNNWLENFAYRISVSWWMFLMSGALALLIALLTVSVQAIKASLTDPARALRHE